MKKNAVAAVCALLPAIAMGASATFAPPPWAYPSMDPGFQRPLDDGLPKRLPGSDKSFTMSQIANFDNIPDWYPDEHPPLPDIVAHGRKPDPRACGACHLPNGMGHPESSSLAGLSANYIIQQMQDFKTGARKSSSPARSASMTAIASAATDDEIKSAAAYFSSLKRTHWVTVKEVAAAPVTYVGLGSMRHAKPNGGTEPIGQRIIEVPENSERAEMRDSHSPFVAYVPVGSIKKGEVLATTGGNGKTISCAVCHGPDLKGLGDIPGLAGRSPIYIARQLFDIREGSRNGAGAQLMKGVVAKLTDEDVVNLSAYAASLAP